MCMGDITAIILSRECFCNHEPDQARIPTDLGTLFVRHQASVAPAVCPEGT